ncbi:hypothetical protein, partial [Salmonella sp. s51944]|uniref:hypothetical protein n=1 Tax=Salmonella sp. s51944 TaxID=3159655 RepID=UPI003980996A
AGHRTSLKWLINIHELSFLPNTPWQKVQTVLESSLAGRIREDIVTMTPCHRSALFDLMGNTFFENHIPDFEVDFTNVATQLEINEVKRYLQKTLK